MVLTLSCVVRLSFPDVRDSCYAASFIWITTCRYSYHHKLIPLLLTCASDDLVDIRTKSHLLWDKVLHCTMQRIYMAIAAHYFTIDRIEI